MEVLQHLLVSRLVLSMRQRLDLYVVLELLLLEDTALGLIPVVILPLTVDHLSEGPSYDVERVPLEVFDGALDHDELVLRMEDGLAPASEILQGLVLLGADEVVTQLTVSLVSSGFMLLDDVVFLLDCLTLHQTD